jgi:hypothetical protein
VLYPVDRWPGANQGRPRPVIGGGRVRLFRARARLRLIQPLRRRFPLFRYLRPSS